MADMFIEIAWTDGTMVRVREEINYDDDYPMVTGKWLGDDDPEDVLMRWAQDDLYSGLVYALDDGEKPGGRQVAYVSITEATPFLRVV